MPARLGAYTPAHLTSGTTQVATGPGTLHAIIINLGAAGTITITDGTSTITGTTIGIITATATTPPTAVPFNVTYGNGLRIALSATMDVTVAFI